MKNDRAQKGIGIIIAMLMMALLLFSGQSFAQGADISDDQLLAFVRTQAPLQQIQVRYEPKIHAAADEAEQHSLIQQANQEMVQVVESEGLTVEQFNTIASEAQTNPEVQQRIEDELQQQ